MSDALGFELPSALMEPAVIDQRRCRSTPRRRLMPSRSPRRFPPLTKPFIDRSSRAARLQKILSPRGIASRRAAETYITEGRVSVNGETVTTLGTKADPETDDIRVDGRRVKTAQRRLYILMYKPRGYITSRSDPQRRPTVIDLLVKGGVRDYVYPVGRLDYESEGLLLLTSDGELAAQLTHPSHGVEREYQVKVLGVPDEHDLQRLAKGIVIDGRRTQPADVKR